MVQENNRVAIVTGATSGIGAELARDLYNRGWKVACVGRGEQKGLELEKSLGLNARFFKGDISDYQSQAEVFRQIFKLWGRIDALCANAGAVDQSSIYLLNQRENSVDDIPEEPPLVATDTNYKGLIYGTQLAMHFMKFNQPAGGKIVITGSIGGMFPHRTYPEYCGTKAAVNMFVQNVAPILKSKHNIYINCILPGMVDTSIVPPEMTAAVSPECLTPMQTILDAYQLFLNDTEQKAGQLLECSVKEMIEYPEREMLNGRFTKRAVTVWEPLFRMMHGENSGLPDALQ
ncbi:hypothetical protein BDV59DRAFT_209244 [Aspergillus ambiguus]|uniref:uncharacterized protein n=1 Tax=Aspergillus ambiguus TaxID=176160 RepID=UPI003CCE4298